MNYTVKQNDNLQDIARTFGVSVNDLMSYNNLSSSRLFPGMVIIIPPIRPRPPQPPRPQPPRPPMYRTYFVRRGDTIYSIARMFGVSVRSIMNRNNLYFPIVFPGQRLIIPFSSRHF